MGKTGSTATTAGVAADGGRRQQMGRGPCHINVYHYDRQR
jgi:hypothetical protein